MVAPKIHDIFAQYRVDMNQELQLPASYTAGGVIFDLSLYLLPIYNAIVTRCYTKSGSDKIATLSYSGIPSEVGANNYANGKLLVKMLDLSIIHLTEVSAGTNLSTFYIDLHVEGKIADITKWSLSGGEWVYTP